MAHLFSVRLQYKNIIIGLSEDDGIKERLEKQIDFYTKSVKIPSVYRVIFIRRVHDLIAQIPYMMLAYRIINELHGSYNTPNFKMFLKRKRSEWFYRVCWFNESLIQSILIENLSKKAAKLKLKSSAMIE